MSLAKLFGWCFSCRLWSSWNSWWTVFIWKLWCEFSFVTFSFLYSVFFSRELEDNDEDAPTNEDEIDDDSEVISKLLEADDTSSDEDFYCSDDARRGEQPRRSKRLCSSYTNDSDCSSPTADDEPKWSIVTSSSVDQCFQTFYNTLDIPKLYFSNWFKIKVIGEYL